MTIPIMFSFVCTVARGGGGGGGVTIIFTYYFVYFDEDGRYFCNEFLAIE